VTEQEWLACTDPETMLGHLRAGKENRSRNGRRKLRLFGCACGRRVVRLMSGRGRRWLELGEQDADALLDEEQRRRVCTEDIGPLDGPRADHEADLAAWFTLGPSVMIAAGSAARSAAGAIEIEAWHRGADYRAAEAAERREQARLLRDLFGNPFRPPRPPDAAWLAWNDGTVRRLATAIYEEGRFGDLPVLAEALEQAGCDSVEILSHCRGPGPHVRGCWVLDLLLEKG
jgi:hypothetical protein